MELTEKEAGLTLENQYGYTCSPATEPYLYFGEGTFEGVDPNCEKFHIYVVPYETYPPCGGAGMLVLNAFILTLGNMKITIAY